MKDYSFGNHICSLRMGLGLSQFQLGNLVGVSDKAVSKWENGNSKPRISTCYRLAEVLGVSINELLSCKDISCARKDIKTMNNQLWKEVHNNLHTIYGNNPPVQCLNRLMYEENLLNQTEAIQNYKIVKEIREFASSLKSPILIDGFINSVFTAWLFGATDINPLPPHYHCPHCGTTIFVNDVNDCFDLDVKQCSCGHDFNRDGHNIPFIGYSISEQLSGGQITIKASKKLCAAIERFLISRYFDNYQIVPVIQEDGSPSKLYVLISKQKNKPFLSTDGFWHTTLQEFFEWYDNELTFVLTCDEDFNRIEFFLNKNNLSVPELNELLNYTLLNSLYGEIIEYNPRFSQFELTFSTLLKTYGFLHSCNAWENNGENLFNNGSAKLSDIPSCREDVWNDIAFSLRSSGISENDIATSISENARKGRYCYHGMPAEIESIIKALNLPQWYSTYLKNVKYLVSKRQCIIYMTKNLLNSWFQEKNK